MQAVLFAAAMAAQMIGALPLTHDAMSDSQNYAKACQAAEDRGAPLMVLIDDARTSKGRKITIPPYQHVVEDNDLIVCRVDVNTTFGVRLADAFDVSSYPYAVVKDADGDILYRGAGDWIQPQAKAGDTPTLGQTLTKVEVAKPVINSTIRAAASELPTTDSDTMLPESDSPQLADDVTPIAEETFAVSSIDTALERAKEARRLLVVFIKSDSCYYCVKMKQESLADEEVQATVANRFVSATIKAEDSRSFVANQGIRMFPTTLVLDSEGGLVDRLEGFVTADQLVNRLERATSTLVSQR